MRSQLSAEPGVLVVGTDPAEWWANPDDLLRATQAQSTELQGAAATVSHSEGWTEGGIGWGAVKADIVFPQRFGRHAENYRDPGSSLRRLDDRAVPRVSRRGQRGDRRQGAHCLIRGWARRRRCGMAWDLSRPEPTVHHACVAPHGRRCPMDRWCHRCPAPSKTVAAVRGVS